VARLIAFLRGINVGGKTTVSMAALRQIVDGLGYKDVRTHLQSGNVVFTSDKPPQAASRELEGALERELGLPIRVVVRTRGELADVVARDALADVATDPAHYVVIFLSQPPDPERLASIDPSAYEPDAFRASGREIYVWFPNGMGRSRLMSVLSDKGLGVVATARNWNTVTALLRIADAS
jgi:uncharacterized protein (DUF1697 family)